MKRDGVRITFLGVVRGSAPDTTVWGKTLSLTSISPLTGQISSFGTVRFIELEGGFFGIITPDGKHYLPLNLPAEFQVDGMPVTFTAREKTNVATIVMWGIPVELDAIESVGGQLLSPEGSWSLVKCDGHSLILGATITAEFRSPGMITGNAGCNQYFAQYTPTGSALTIGTIGCTEMYCSSPEGVMEQEHEYLALLPKAAAYAMNGGNLVIWDASGREILVYTTAVSDEPAPLITYSRTGGLAGVDDHLVLFANGSGTVTRTGISRPVRVPQPVMADLISHLTAADFPSLNNRYPAPVEGADYFTYTLASGGMTVVTEDTGVPAVLVPIINILDDIVTSVRMVGESGHSLVPDFF
jgi:heat shock protein HslJ